MCGRGAVIRGGAGIARIVGAARVVRAAPRPRRMDAAGRGRAAAGGGGAGGGAGAGAGGAMGMFRDAGHVPASSARSAGDAHGVVAAADKDQFPEVQKQLQQQEQQAPQQLVKQEPFEFSEVKKDSIASSGSNSSTEADATATGSSYQNFNVVPFGTLPVWRIQTVEEQKELLSTEQQTSDPSVKSELDELLGSATSSSTFHSVPIIQYMRFGWHSPFAGEGASGGVLFNARSESVQEKAMFKKLLQRKRAVVVLDGFYEFHTEVQPNGTERKQPYFFHHSISSSSSQSPTISVAKKDALPAGESPFPPMYMAALYDAAIDDAGEAVYSVVILTTGPSQEMKKIHTRMPCILTKEEADKWVDVDHYSFDQVKSCLHPFEGLCYYKTPPLVNSWKNRSIECIEPLDQYEKRMKASGIGRFFSPVKKSAQTTTSSTTSSQSASSTSSSSSSTSSSFFNPTHEPGRVFFPSRLNPSDPGAGPDGDKSTVLKPSNETSDAAETVEEIVQATKNKESEDVHMSPSSRKRKVGEGEEEAEQKQQPEPTKQTSEPATKKRKPTAAERAHQQQQQ